MGRVVRRLARATQSRAGAAGLVALALGATGCVPNLIKGDVIKSADGWTFDLTRLVAGPNPQLDGKPTWALPPDGDRWLWAFIHVRNDAPAPRVFGYDSCSVDLDDGFMVPSLVGNFFFVIDDRSETYSARAGQLPAAHLRLPDRPNPPRAPLRQRRLRGPADANEGGARELAFSGDGGARRRRGPSPCSRWAPRREPRRELDRRSPTCSRRRLPRRPSTPTRTSSFTSARPAPSARRIRPGAPCAGSSTASIPTRRCSSSPPAAPIWPGRRAPTTTPSRGCRWAATSSASRAWS